MKLIRTQHHGPCVGHGGHRGGGPNGLVGRVARKEQTKQQARDGEESPLVVVNLRINQYKSV